MLEFLKKLFQSQPKVTRLDVTKRFQLVSRVGQGSMSKVWRAIDDPIVRNPLAIADARSIDMKDLIVAERRFPHRVGQTYRAAWNAAHQWFWFPRMTRDEALVFKVYDSETDGRARFVPHTSFEDPATPADAPPRHSIEIRTIAFF